MRRMQEYLTQATESWSMFTGWDSEVATIGAVAVVLAAIWLFFRIIRTVVAVLFVLCVAFLVLKTCYGIDLAPWLQPLWAGIISSF